MSIQSNPGFRDTTATVTCPLSCHPNCSSFSSLPLRLYSTNTRGLEIVDGILATRSPWCSGKWSTVKFIRFRKVSIFQTRDSQISDFARAVHSRHPFPADRLHRLRPKISRLLFALKWHRPAEWLRLNDPFCSERGSDAAATAAPKIANAFEWPTAQTTP